VPPRPIDRTRHEQALSQAEANWPQAQGKAEDTELIALGVHPKTLVRR
jgi:hypothetical protein